MGAKWPAFTAPKQLGMPGNDEGHAFTDPNSGGGPAAPVVRNAKRIPNAQRGGPYQSGLRQYANTSIRGTVGGKGNPANRGGMPSEGRQSFPSETRVPNHGGSPQVRDNMDTVSGRGGFGHTGQAGVPGVRTNPRPGAGNTGGRMARRIGGRFKQDTKGARATGTVGSYGRDAITTST